MGRGRERGRETRGGGSRLDRSTTRKDTRVGFTTHTHPQTPSHHTHTHTHTHHNRARSKRIIKNIDVYALGVYMDAPALADRATTSPSPEAAVASLADDATLPKTVRVVVTTGLMTAPRFLKSVKESLLPALTARGAAPSFDAFASLFDGTPLTKGTEIVFSNAPDGALAVRIAGADVGSVKDARFGPALFGLWLGAAPVSPDARASVVAGVAAARAAAAEE